MATTHCQTAGRDECAQSGSTSPKTLLGKAQNISAAMMLADRGYIINNAHIFELLTAQAVREQPKLLHRHLGV